MEQNSSSIVNPERIVRILQKIAEVNLRVILRCQDNTMVAIRGQVAAVNSITNSQQQPIQVLKIDGISFKGFKLLEAQQTIQIEFLLKATKVVFVSKIINVNKEFLFVSIPRKLSTIERRANERCLTTDDMNGYLTLDINQNAQWPFACSPVYPEYKKLENYFRLSDVSIGGVCVSSFFPMLNQTLVQGYVDPRAKIVLPLRAPIECPVEVRWIKRIKEFHKDKSGKDYAITMYKFGFEFKEISDELKFELQHYMKALAQAEAV